MNKLLSIGQTAKLLGISIDTLRRWDSAGRFRSIRSGPKGHRFYNRSEIDQFLLEIDTLAFNWAKSNTPSEPNSESYCQTRDIFQARLEKLQSQLNRFTTIEVVSLITAVAGEIGNNSFDHNLGNWPDIPGIYFSYSLRNRKVVLADRGQGVLTTLKRVRPGLVNSTEAIKVAFTETISGRYPETRGNGLKFVRSIIIKEPFSLTFQSGNTQLYLKKNDNKLNMKQTEISIKGCFAIINFEELI